MSQKQPTSVNEEEISQFSRQAYDWWNPKGSFAPLHRLNPVRLEYICSTFEKHTQKQKPTKRLLQGKKILDVGCGGGILTEPLARLGGHVLGLDASKEGIDAAMDHAKQSNLDIRYEVGTAEDLARQHQGRFDIITALEIVEHVADIGLLFHSLTTLLKPGGLLFVSTLNRTPKSYLLGIVAAEHILEWVPKGTHQWNKFVRPSEIVELLSNEGLEVEEIMGIVYNPFLGRFVLKEQATSVNYILVAHKPKS